MLKKLKWLLRGKRFPTPAVDRRHRFFFNQIWPIFRINIPAKCVFELNLSTFLSLDLHFLLSGSDLWHVTVTVVWLRYGGVGGFEQPLPCRASAEVLTLRWWRPWRCRDSRRKWSLDAPSYPIHNLRRVIPQSWWGVREKEVKRRGQMWGREALMLFCVSHSLIQIFYHDSRMHSRARCSRTTKTERYGHNTQDVWKCI